MSEVYIVIIDKSFNNFGYPKAVFSNLSQAQEYIKKLTEEEIKRLGLPFDNFVVIKCPFVSKSNNKFVYLWNYIKEKIKLLF